MNPLCFVIRCHDSRLREYAAITASPIDWNPRVITFHCFLMNMGLKITDCQQILYIIRKTCAPFIFASTSATTPGPAELKELPQ